VKVTTTPFAMVPLWVYRHDATTPTVMQVYIALASRAYDRKAPRGVPWIMEETGLGKTSVYSALATLRELGAVVDCTDGIFLPLDDPHRDSATTEHPTPPPSSDSATAESPSAHTEPDSATAECTVSLERVLEGSSREPLAAAPQAPLDDVVAEPSEEPVPDPVDQMAQRLTALAYEQRVRPSPRGGFLSVRGIVRTLLTNGHAPQAVADAIVAGGIVWTLAGMEVALNRSRPRPNSADAGRATLRDLIESGTL